MSSGGNLYHTALIALSCWILRRNKDVSGSWAASDQDPYVVRPLSGCEEMAATRRKLGGMELHSRAAASGQNMNRTHVEKGLSA